VSLPAAVAAAAEGVPALPSPELVIFLPVASTSKLIDKDEVAGLHTLPHPPLQLVQEPTLLLLLADLAAAAAAVAAARLAAAGVTPHMSGGGLGPFLAL
jgi:hypothetical protein